MRILYLHQYFATPSAQAGTRSYEMAKRLIKSGHSVTFITTSAFFSSEYNFSSGWNYITIDGIKLHVLNLNYSNKDPFYIRIIKFVSFSLRSSLKALTINADVVLATSTPLSIAIPGLLFSKLKKVPLVFEVRDLWPELPVATGVIKNRVFIKAAKWLERYTYKNSKRLIGLSPGMCAGISREGIDPQKITLATNSCDTDLFDVPNAVGEQYRNQKLSFVGARKLIVYTGTFGRINNVGYIVGLARESVRLGLNLCFVAVGDGMEKEKVIQEAENAGVLDRNLYIIPPVPKTEIVRLLSTADLALSLFGPVKEMWHNSANKLFDALASQTPIAINYGGWQKDIIDEHQCGLVLDAENHSSASIELSKFLNNDEKYESAVASCKQLSYESFSRDTMALRVERALLEAVDG